MKLSQLDLPGAQAPIPELEPEDGYLVIQKENLYAIVRRVQPLDVLLMELIGCRTTSARKKSKAARLVRLPLGCLRATIVGFALRHSCDNSRHAGVIPITGRDRREYC